MSWKVTLTEKSAGCDFDIEDFDPADFECVGWGWKMMVLVEKGALKMELKRK